MVLALGLFLVNYSALLCVPICVNYVVECFVDFPMEVGVAMNIYREGFGLVIPFFLSQWQGRVGIGWVFGTGALLTLFAAMLLGAASRYGSQLRMASFSMGLIRSEAGIEIADRQIQEPPLH